MMPDANILFDHVHFISEKPRAAAAWYVDKLGGEIVNRRVDYPEHPISSLDPSLNTPTHRGALPLLERPAGAPAPARSRPVILAAQAPFTNKVVQPALLRRYELRRFLRELLQGMLDGRKGRDQRMMSSVGR